MCLCSTLNTVLEIQHSRDTVGNIAAGKDPKQNVWQYLTLDSHLFMQFQEDFSQADTCSTVVFVTLCVCVCNGICWTVLTDSLHWTLL